MKISSVLLVILIAIIHSVSTTTFFKSLTQTAYGQASISDGALTRHHHHLHLISSEDGSVNTQLQEM
jgi:hypothetical protein